MPRKAKGRRRPEDSHTQLAIHVERYDVSIDASINHSVYAPQHAWNLNEEDPVYQFTMRLTITGIASYPEDRAGDVYEVTIHGDDAPSMDHNARLREARARDKNGSPKYRKYRDVDFPIYNEPKGLGFLEKARGESTWRAWVFAPTRFGRDMLALLNQGRDLYMGIYERKIDRARWIRNLTLQTTDPALD